MFERFTDRARGVVRQARAEARAEGERPVGTEHLLLAILGGDGDGEDVGLAVRVLRDVGVTAEDLRERIRRHAETGRSGLGEADAAALREIGIDLSAIVARIEESFGPDALREAMPAPRRRWGRRRHVGGPFSPRAKKVLELSLREAVRLRHKHIGTEHILLGLLREGNGLAALVLTEAGVDLADTRRRVEAALRTAA
ncbi:Clp amino terminal domain-containing protein, pathogenicity island component [Micromonospora phaseoli]|uniref:Clp amino terminal domain-containing protein, pathogenicity island component n=1 Tax=Micromonospora phaseoli TaxID=1144548 RepID=A0A1H6S040_9ACTN|nr:Clp protease N-terminal domain-containing protein [Micromonospora phaseoli]PZW03740.1 ClpA/ClpB-like protein [Micromonospora phaseoli]GIJ81335.1 ATPase [Micromonospora phaseoli]SEI61279.1 Clp amino terminal domain-containing protein, pathogenicity island component [Micromonospora phaseoli]